MLVALLAVAAAWAVGSAQAQDTCRQTEDLGALRSHQTITRIGLLTSASCRFDDGSYYDYYDFDLPGAGEIAFSLSSSDFDERVGLYTRTGEFLSAGHRSLTRTLPAGRYKVTAQSRQTERAGAYTLTIKTKRLATPPPEPEEEEPQTDDEVAPPGDGTTVSGHVIARLQPLPEGHARGRYQIEFGFLSTEALSSENDRTAAVAANEHLLPPQRFLTEARLLARSRANDRRWLHSSPVDVLAAGGEGMGLSGEPLLTGRVIARWNPTSGGAFAVEFGFLPLWAFEAAGDDAQRAAELFETLLPERRFFTQSRIEADLRRNQPIWRTSQPPSAIPTKPPTGTTSCVGPAAITPAAVPLALPRGERIADVAIATIHARLANTFMPVEVNGLPPGLTHHVAASRADGCEHQVTVSGTIPPDTPTRTYSALITADVGDGEVVTATVNIQLPPPTGPIEIEWGGYSPATTSIGGTVRIVQPRVVSPSPPPPSMTMTWTFETRTTDVCSVDSRSGVLMLTGEGACQVTLTASAPGYRPGTASAQVIVGPLPPCEIGWSGYNPASVEFGDPAPTPLPPQCWVNGRMHSPEWRYSVAPGSSDVCRVNEATGALTITRVGECRINLANTPKPPEYGAGRASASVQVRMGTGEVQWAGYSPANVRLGDTPPTLLPPAVSPPPSSSIRFNYQSVTSSVCAVDPMSGVLTLIAEGTCSVTLTASGDPNYRLAPVTRTVVIEPPGVEPPEIVEITCTPSEPRVEQIVTCLPQMDGGDPTSWSWSNDAPIEFHADDYDDDAEPNPEWSGTAERYSTTFGQSGQWRVSLTVHNSAGSDTGSTTVDVQPPPIEPPEITIHCPPSADVDENITCTVINSGGAIDSYDWSDSEGGSGSSASYHTNFNSSGSKTVSLTASNASGSVVDTTVVTVSSSQPTNLPPTCEPVPDVSVSLTGYKRLELTEICTDPDRDPLLFTITSTDTLVEAPLRLRRPSGLMVPYESDTRITRDQNMTPDSTYTRIRGERIGTATVTITATDHPGGLSATTSFKLKVGDLRPVLTCDSLPHTYVTTLGSDRNPLASATTTVDLRSCFTDPEGRILRYTVVAERGDADKVRIAASDFGLTVTARYPSLRGSMTLDVAAYDTSNNQDRYSLTVPWPVTVLAWGGEWAYCTESNGTKVRYHFNTETWTKHRLDVTAEQVRSIFGRDLRRHSWRAACQADVITEWPDGDPYDEADVRALVQQ